MDNNEYSIRTELTGKQLYAVDQAKAIDITNFSLLIKDITFDLMGQFCDVISNLNIKERDKTSHLEKLKTIIMHFDEHFPTTKNNSLKNLHEYLLACGIDIQIFDRHLYNIIYEVLRTEIPEAKWNKEELYKYEVSLPSLLNDLVIKVNQIEAHIGKRNFAIQNGVTMFEEYLSKAPSIVVRFQLINQVIDILNDYGITQNTWEGASTNIFKAPFNTNLKELKCEVEAIRLAQLPKSLTKKQMHPIK